MTPTSAVARLRGWGAGRSAIQGAAWSLLLIGTTALIWAPWLPRGERILGSLGVILVTTGVISAVLAVVVLSGRTGPVPPGRLILGGLVVNSVALAAMAWRARAELREGLADALPLILAGAAAAGLVGWALVGIGQILSSSETPSAPGTDLPAASPPRWHAWLAGAVASAVLGPAVVVPFAHWRVEAAVVDHATAKTTAERLPMAVIPSAISRVAWKWRSSEPITAVTAGGPGAIVQSGRRITAIDGRSGRERWHYDRTDLGPVVPFGNSLSAVASTDGSTVLINLSVEALQARGRRKYAGRVIALDAGTGKELWRSEGLMTAIAASSGRVVMWDYLGYDGQQVSVRDLRTGRERWRWQGRDVRRNYVAASGETLLMFRDRDWRIGQGKDLPEVITIGRDGTVHGPTRIAAPPGTEWSGSAEAYPWLLDPAAPDRPPLNLATGAAPRLRRWRVPISVDATPGEPTPAEPMPGELAPNGAVPESGLKAVEINRQLPERVMTAVGSATVPAVYELPPGKAGPRYRAVRPGGGQAWTLGDLAGVSLTPADLTAEKLLVWSPLDAQERFSVALVDRQTGRAAEAVPVSVPGADPSNKDILAGRMRGLFAPGAVVLFRQEGRTVVGLT